MSYHSDPKRRQAERLMVTFLQEQTGIPETQALDLIRTLGMDRSSLLREAKELARGSKPDDR